MEKSNFALRLLPSLLKSAQRVAERENCSVNQLINLALGEKIAVLEEEYWRERGERARLNPKSRNIMDRLAGDEPPAAADSIRSASRLTRKRKPAKTLAAGQTRAS